MCLLDSEFLLFFNVASFRVPESSIVYYYFGYVIIGACAEAPVVKPKFHFLIYLLLSNEV